MKGLKNIPTHYRHLTGDVRFKESMERQIGKNLSYSKKRRPKKWTVLIEK